MYSENTWITWMKFVKLDFAELPLVALLYSSSIVAFNFMFGLISITDLKYSVYFLPYSMMLSNLLK